MHSFSVSVKKRFPGRVTHAASTARAATQLDKRVTV